MDELDPRELRQLYIEVLERGMKIPNTIQELKIELNLRALEEVFGYITVSQIMGAIELIDWKNT